MDFILILEHIYEQLEQVRNKELADLVLQTSLLEPSNYPSPPLQMGTEPSAQHPRQIDEGTNDLGKLAEDKSSNNLFKYIKEEPYDDQLKKVVRNPAQPLPPPKFKQVTHVELGNAVMSLDYYQRMQNQIQDSEVPNPSTNLPTANPVANSPTVQPVQNQARNNLMNRDPIVLAVQLGCGWGKSTMAAAMAAHYVRKDPHQKVFIVTATDWLQWQVSLLFDTESDI